VLQTKAVLRRVLSGVFSATLALACVVAAPSGTRATGTDRISADQVVLGQPGRGEVRVGRTGEVRLVPGLATGLSVALLPVAGGLPPRQASGLAAPAGERPRASSRTSSSWSARGPPA
jgi:hypothetical protein